MIRLIDGLTAAQSGVFLNYDGKSLPWQFPGYTRPGAPFC